jgi:hypothetical protein
MQRRTWLKLGLVTATGLAVVGGGLALRAPAWTVDGLTASGRSVLGAVAAAVLDGSLPEDGTARQAALVAWFKRLDDSISALPPHTQVELAQLLSVLASAPGRWALAGLSSDWADASVAQVRAALTDMRHSRLALRQQAYLALRELTCAAYFADPSTWMALGYSGPLDM